MIHFVIMISAFLCNLLLLMGTTHADELFRPRGTGGNMFSKPPVSPVLVRPTVISPTSPPSPKVSPILLPELDSPTIENNSTMTTPNLDENPSFISTECWTIARGQGALNFPFVRFQAKLTVLLSDTIRIVLLRLRDLLEMYVATDLLDCTALTQRLDTIRNVRLGTSVNETTTDCVDCTEIGITVDIYFVEGSDTSRFGEYLYDTLASLCLRIESMNGIAETLEPCRYLRLMDLNGILFRGEIDMRNVTEPRDDDTDLHSDDDNRLETTNDTVTDTDAARAPAVEKERVSTSGIMTLSFSALTILLAIIVASKRRKQVNEVKHSESTEDPTMDEPYLNDSEGMSTTRSASPSGHSFVHEDERTMPFSSFSSTDASSVPSLPIPSQLPFVAIMKEMDLDTTSWSENSHKYRPSATLQAGDVSPIGLFTHDEHQCTSALCRICEGQEEDMDLHSIPTRVSGHSSDGLSSRRTYGSRDTIDI